jgi:hypothetical protein
MVGADRLSSDAMSSKISADIARYTSTSTGLLNGIMPARWHDLALGERIGSDF